MNIYLLRHGQALQTADIDSSRSLTLLGTQHIEFLAKTFVARGHKIERCFASPYLRTQQTAEIFLKNSKLDFAIENSSILRPDKSPARVIRLLENVEEANKESNILLVGHNPFLSELYRMLTQANQDYAIKVLAAGELCGIHFDMFGLGLGSDMLNIPPSKN